jgi:hypothetical protein
MSPKIYALGILGFSLAAITGIGLFLNSQKIEPRVSGNDFYPLSETNRESIFEQPQESGEATSVQNIDQQTKNDILTTDGEVVGEITTNIQTTSLTTESCGTQGCFEKKFKLCQPATFTTTAEGLGSVRYTILTKTNTGCSLTFRYLEVPNPAWKNKDLTCIYDTTLSFEEAYQKTFESAIAAENPTCSGQLYEEFKKMNQR